MSNTYQRISPIAKDSMFLHKNKVSKYSTIHCIDDNFSLAARLQIDPATSPVYKQDMAAREAIVQCYNSLPLFVVFPIVWPMLISHCQDSVPCEQRTTVYKQRGQRIEVLKGNMLFLLAQYQLKRKRYLWKQEAMIHPFVCLYISSP